MHTPVSSTMLNTLKPISDTAPDSAAMRLVIARRNFTAGYPQRYAEYLYNKVRDTC